MHLQTKRVFTEQNPSLRKLEVLVLKAEILACKFLRCNELIVHLKQGTISQKERRIFSKLLGFARKNEIEMLYEPNSNFDGKAFLCNLSKFPELKVNLDLCHLAMAVKNKTLGISLENFLNKVKKRVTYIHASGYDGTNTHVDLSKTTFPWRQVLKRLDLSKIKKIIAELHNFNELKQTIKSLQRFLSSI